MCIKLGGQVGSCLSLCISSRRFKSRIALFFMSVFFSFFLILFCLAPCMYVWFHNQVTLRPDTYIIPVPGKYIHMPTECCCSCCCCCSVLLYCCSCCCSLFAEVVRRRVLDGNICCWFIESDYFSSNTIYF